MYKTLQQRASSELLTCSQHCQVKLHVKSSRAGSSGTLLKKKWVFKSQGRQPLSARKLWKKHEEALLGAVIRVLFSWRSMGCLTPVICAHHEAKAVVEECCATLVAASWGGWGARAACETTHVVKKATRWSPPLLSYGVLGTAHGLHTQVQTCSFLPWDLSTQRQKSPCLVHSCWYVQNHKQDFSWGYGKSSSLSRDKQVGKVSNGWEE